jgi:peroxiredoxin
MPSLTILKIRCAILRCLVSAATVAAVLVLGPVTARSAELKVGAPAPDFEALDDTGKPWKSSDHVGKEIVVVYFYPADMTGGCTKQACGFRDDMKPLREKGVTVVGVSGDSVRNHQLFKKAHGLEFALLADTEGKVAEAFGVPVTVGEKVVTAEIDGKTEQLMRTVTAKRWTFVIDTDKKIALMNTEVNAAEDSKKILALVAERVAPTAANVAYGPLERQVLDFWQAKSDTPTPVVICIHGGGWNGGDKAGYAKGVKPFLDAGISVVSINYRLMKQANDQKVTPPVKAPLEDAARAVQFVRSKAKEWNIDPERIGATGGSAGGCSSLWLAFHDDMADPSSSDPVAKQSTRLACAAVGGAQVSLDPKENRAWLPNYTYGAHAFGLPNLETVEQERERLAAWIKEYSPISHVTKDDPPIGLYYGGVPGAKKGEVHKDPTHSPMLGLMLAEKLQSAGVGVAFHSNTTPNEKLPNANAFLIEHLTKQK